MAHAWNLSNRKVEIESSEVQSQPGLNIKTLSQARPPPKNPLETQNETNKNVSETNVFNCLELYFYDAIKPTELSFWAQIKNLCLGLEVWPKW
jgi:hypothetical protein